MARTTVALVVELMSAGPRDYDGKSSLAPAIRAATLVVDQVARCATARGASFPSDVALEMETWLAAHFHTKRDRVYTSNSTKGSSASFVLDKDVPEPYKSGALMLDFTGCLASILTTTKASVSWGGKTDDEKLSYDERN